MATQRSTFGALPSSVALRDYVKASLEAAGYVVTVETEVVGHHKFVLHTLVAVAPKKLHPIKFTRAGDYL